MQLFRSTAPPLPPHPPPNSCSSSGLFILYLFPYMLMQERVRMFSNSIAQVEHLIFAFDFDIKASCSVRCCSGSKRWSCKRFSGVMCRGDISCCLWAGDGVGSGGSTDLNFIAMPITRTSCISSRTFPSPEISSPSSFLA